MNVNLKNLVSITEANQNFSQVAKMADKNGTVVILKNNTPRYVLIEYDRLQNSLLPDDTTIEQAAVEYFKEKDSENAINYHFVWAIKAMVSELKAKGMRKVLICCFKNDLITDQNKYSINYFNHFFDLSNPRFVSDWHLERILQILKQEEIDTCIFSKFKPDFSIEEAAAGVNTYIESDADCIIVLDSVYSLDMAKTISLKLKNPDFCDLKKLPDKISLEDAGTLIFVLPFWTRRV